jgi:CRP/FNR family transcriptional regulator, cyclic AMP receptor protein
VLLQRSLEGAILAECGRVAPEDSVLVGAEAAIVGPMATPSDASPDAPRSILAVPTLAAQAQALLRRPTALSELTAEEAGCVVTYMRLASYAPGAVLLREGDAQSTGYMLLVLRGDVTVESAVVSRHAPVVMSVLGEGHLIGEMGLLDGEPRAATCVANTAVVGAALSRRSVRQMMADHPDVAAKLLAAVSQRLAARLREASRQQRVYVQLVRAMQGEIEALEAKLLQVMQGAQRRSATSADNPDTD